MSSVPGGRHDISEAAGAATDRSSRRPLAWRVVGSDWSAGRFLFGGPAALPGRRCGLSAELKLFIVAGKDLIPECIDAVD